MKKGGCRGAKPLCRESEVPLKYYLFPLPGQEGGQGMVERIFSSLLEGSISGRPKKEVVFEQA